MKILYLGTFQKHCSDLYRLKGFFEIGLDIYALDFRKIFSKYGSEGLRNSVVHTIYFYQPDLIFVNKGEKFSVEDLEEIQRLFSGIPWMLFYGDQRTTFPKFLRENLTQYDLFLVNSDDENYKRTIKKYCSNRIVYYHSATDLEIYKKDFSVEEIFDVAFFGGNYRDSFPNSKFRQMVIKKLKRDKNFNLMTYGTNWGFGSHPVYGEDYAYNASKAKVILGINSFDKINLYSSNRLWNSMACGFHITHYFKGLEKLFKNHVHLVWFYKYSELKSILEYYLDHPTERKKIYKAGRAELEKKHTYQVRAEQVVKLYKELKK
jgi:spore maturation protein CgeB